MLGTKSERHYGVLIFSLGFIILFQSLAIGHDASRLEQPALSILMPLDAAPGGPEPASRAAPAAVAAPSASPPAQSEPARASVPTTLPVLEDLTYTLQKGDSFYGVARQFGMSARQLAAANGLPRPWAPTGTVLRVPRQRPPLTDDTDALQAIEMSYKVRRGDTLANLAERFHENVSELMTDNKLCDGTEPGVGRQLRLRIPPWFEYRVGNGESLWKVSKTFQVSLAGLVDMNDLALADLKPGQVIRVPVTDPALLDRLWREKHPEPKKPADTGRFVAPVIGRLTDLFGYRIHPIFQVQNFHSGVDFAAAAGTPIRAARAGVVEFSGVKPGYGRLVIVRHPDGLESWYGHCSRLLTRAGARVRAGALLARVGSSGSATGPHVHFEIRRNDRPVNPLKYLRG